MKDEQLREAQYTFIKLLVCLQATIELFDDVEGTPYYRQDLKSAINNTRNKVIAALNTTYGFIDNGEKEETMRSIDRAVNRIIITSVEHLFIKGYEDTP